MESNMTALEAVEQVLQDEGGGSIKRKRQAVVFQPDFSERVAEVREMEAKQTESKHRLDDLFQSMLHRAFEGEL
jgi:hypothetical protein